MSGLSKVLWVILLIVLPYIGIFAYIFTQGPGMAERNEARAKEAREELRQIVGSSAPEKLIGSSRQGRFQSKSTRA